MLLVIKNMTEILGSVDPSQIFALGSGNNIIGVNNETRDIAEDRFKVLCLVDEGSNPPAGMEFESSALQLVDGVPTMIYTYMQIPEPELVPQGLALALPRVAFLAMLDLMSEEKGVDIEAGILSFIETQMPISTPQEKASRALAKRLFTEGQEFVGTNPLFSVLVPALGLTQSEFEAAWETAASFTW